MKEIVFKSPKTKVVKIDEDTYELYTLSTRCLDGMMDTGWNLQCTYSKYYCRDWLGRTREYHGLPHDAKKDAVKAAMIYGNCR